MNGSRNKTGRPRTRPSALRDGFYLEVRNRRSDDKGVKLRRDTKKDMLESARMYSKTKVVVLLGERKAEKWLSEPIEFTNDVKLTAK
jgi:hypothetical protein